VGGNLIMLASLAGAIMRIRAPSGIGLCGFKMGSIIVIALWSSNALDWTANNLKRQ